MVLMEIFLVSFILFSSDAIVVVFPDPEGPVMRSMPRSNRVNRPSSEASSNCSRLGIFSGIRRKTTLKWRRSKKTMIRQRTRFSNT